MQHHIVHHISGRIRLRLPELESPDGGARLQAELERCDRCAGSLKSLRFNAAARSLTIEYRGDDRDFLGNLQDCIGRVPANATGEPSERAESAPKSVELAEFDEFAQLTELTDKFTEGAQDWEPLAVPIASLAIAGAAGLVELPIAIVAGAIGWAAWPIVERGLEKLTAEDPDDRQLSVDLLDTLWMAWQVAQGQFVAPALLAAFTEAGIAIRDRTRREERQEISALLDRQTRGHAWIERGDRGERVVAVEVPQVRIGDVAVVSADDRVPIDGEIIEFAPETQLEAPSWCQPTAAILPTVGQEIDAGTLVVRGEIRVRARRSGRATHTAIVRHLGDTATLTETRFGLQVEAAANALVAPTLAGSGVLLAAGVAPTALPLLQLDFGTGLGAVLPTTALSATIGAARQGIYLRDARVLERLVGVSTAVFELSSVVTTVAVTQVYPVCGESGDRHSDRTLECISEQLVSLAVSVYGGLDLAASAAIERYAETDGAKRLACDRHHLVPGGGIEAEIDDRWIHIGSEVWLASQGIDCAPLRSCYPEVFADRSAERSTGHRDDLETFERLLWAACDGELLGAIGIGVQICPTAREAIAALQTQGVTSYLIGDDRVELIRAIAPQLDIPLDRAIGAATPDDRREFFDTLCDRVRPIARPNSATDAGEIREILWASRDRDFEIPFKMPEKPTGDRHGLLVDIGPTLDVTLADRRVDLVAIDGDLRDLPHAIAIARQASTTAIVNTLAVALPNLATVVAGMWLGLHPIWAVTLNQCAVLLAELNGLGLRQGQAKSHRWPQRPLDRREIETAPDDRALEALFDDRHREIQTA